MHHCHLAALARLRDMELDSADADHLSVRVRVLRVRTCVRVRARVCARACVRV
jgi:hypothetical protein